MGQSRSRAVAARQAALDRLLAQQREQLEAVADAAVEVQSAHEERERLLGELRKAEDRLRAAVGTISDLGQSAEQIAMVCELDVSLVRAWRRPRMAPRVAAEPVA